MARDAGLKSDRVFQALNSRLFKRASNTCVNIARNLAQYVASTTVTTALPNNTAAAIDVAA